MSRQVAVVSSKPSQVPRVNPAAVPDLQRRPVTVRQSICHVGTTGKRRQPVRSVSAPGRRLSICRNICLGRTARPRDTSHGHVYTDGRGYCEGCRRFVAMPVCHCCHRKARGRPRKNGKYEVARL